MTSDGVPDPLRELAREAGVNIDRPTAVDVERKRASEHRGISGRRRDLRRVRDAAALRRVWIEGPGIASLEGIERMSQLEQLKLTRVAPSLSLAPLEGVASTLRTLVIVEMRGDFDGRPIAQLSGLRHLVFQANDDAAADAFARVDLSPLARLEALDARTYSARRPLNLRAIANMPALRQLALHGFFVQDRDVPTVCAAPALTLLSLGAESPQVKRKLRECLGKHVDVGDDEQDSLGPFGEIHEHAGQFSVDIDLASEWGLETSYDAEERLQALLRRRAPDLARRLRYDTENAAVVLLADDRASLAQALELVDAETARRRPSR